MRRTIRLGALLALALFGGVAAPARSTDSGTASLTLSAPQQQKLAALENASRAQAGDLFAQIQQVRKKLADLYSAYNFDVTAARRMNQDLNRVQGQLLDLRLSEQQQLRGILSPDQFAQLQATIHKQSDRGPDDPGRGHGHHHWPDHQPDHQPDH